MSSFNQLKRYREALDLLEKYNAPYAQDLRLRSWKAWFLQNADRWEEAVAVYEKMFAQDYRDEEDFQLYTDLLFDLERFGELDRAFARYLNHGRSEVILMAQSKSLFKRNQNKKALSILQELQKSKAFDPEIAHEMIRNYRKMRQHDNVRRICLQLIANGFESADIFYYKGDAEYALEWLPEAKKSLEQALAFSPRDGDLKTYIDHISARLGQGDNSSIKQPIEPVPIPEAFLALQKKAAVKELNHRESNAWFRHRLKCYRFRAGEPLVHTIYWNLQIGNAPGVSEFSTLKVHFDPLNEKIFVNKLDVRDQKGNLIASGNPDQYYVMDTQPDDMATYDQTLYLPVPSLVPGTTIDLVVTKQTKGTYDHFPFKREVLSSSHPIDLGGLSIEGDIKRLAHQCMNIASPQNTKLGWLWTVHDRPAHRWEPVQIDYEKILPIIFVSSASQDWQTIGMNYWRQIESRLQVDDRTRRVARSIVADAATEGQKIDRITEYVQQQITYKPLEFGIRGVIPNTAAATLDNKYGDCKDHAVLLHQLLSAVGIPAHLALVDTQWSVCAGLPSMNQFNHMIVKAGAGADCRFVDATEKGLVAGRLAPMGLGGRYALVLDSKAMRLEKIPGYQPEFCKISSTRQIKVLDQKDLWVSEQIDFQGYMAAHVRSILKSIKPANQSEWAREIIAQHYPESIIVSLKIDHLFDNRQDLTMTLEYRLNDACEQIDAQLLARIPSPWEDYYLKVQPVKDRRTDFKIVYPLTFDSLIAFTLPDRYEADDADDSTELDRKDDYGSWKTVSKLGNGTLQMQFWIHLNDKTFPSTNYARYQKAMDHAIKSVNRKVILKKRATVASRQP